MVYVDIAPLAIAHSRSILDGVIEADLREPEMILGHPPTHRLEQRTGIFLWDGRNRQCTLTLILAFGRGGLLERESLMYPGVDPERPNAARIYDYLLGGTHNFAVDRDAARAAIAIEPSARDVAKANRAFLGRAVRFLAAAGIRQFIDIGSGVPTEGNVHEIVRAVGPESRVVYVDIDKVAIAHSKSILAGDDKATIIEADFREPEKILGQASGLIDFERPVGLLLLAMLHLISDEENPRDLVKRLTRPLASGSCLTISHITSDGQSAPAVEAMRRLNTRFRGPGSFRGHAEIRGLFDGFDLLDPGLVFVPLWRPDGPAPFIDEPERSWNYAGVGRKA